MKYPRGYVAVLSALIISAVLTTLALVSSLGVFWARRSEQEFVDKIESKVYARSCVYESLYLLAQNKTFNPHHVLVWIDHTHTCVIDHVLTDSRNITVYVYATVHNSYTAYELHALQSAKEITISSLKERTSIPP